MSAHVDLKSQRNWNITEHSNFRPVYYVIHAVYEHIIICSLCMHVVWTACRCAIIGSNQDTTLPSSAVHIQLQHTSTNQFHTMISAHLYIQINPHTMISNTISIQTTIRGIDPEKSPYEACDPEIDRKYRSIYRYIQERVATHIVR